MLCLLSYTPAWVMEFRPYCRRRSQFPPMSAPCLLPPDVLPRIFTCGGARPAVRASHDALAPGSGHPERGAHRGLRWHVVTVRGPLIPT